MMITTAKKIIGHRHTQTLVGKDPNDTQRRAKVTETTTLDSVKTVFENGELLAEVSRHLHWTDRHAVSQVNSKVGEASRSKKYLMRLLTADFNSDDLANDVVEFRDNDFDVSPNEFYAFKVMQTIHENMVHPDGRALSIDELNEQGFPPESPEGIGAHLLELAYQLMDSVMTNNPSKRTEKQDQIASIPMVAEVAFGFLTGNLKVKTRLFNYLDNHRPDQQKDVAIMALSSPYTVNYYDTPDTTNPLFLTLPDDLQRDVTVICAALVSTPNVSVFRSEHVQRIWESVPDTVKTNKSKLVDLFTHLAFDLDKDMGMFCAKQIFKLLSKDMRDNTSVSAFYKLACAKLDDNSNQSPPNTAADLYAALPRELKSDADIIFAILTAPGIDTHSRSDHVQTVWASLPSNVKSDTSSILEIFANLAVTADSELSVFCANQLFHLLPRQTKESISVSGFYQTLFEGKDLNQNPPLDINRPTMSKGS